MPARGLPFCRSSSTVEAVRSARLVSSSRRPASRETIDDASIAPIAGARRALRHDCVTKSPSITSLLLVQSDHGLDGRATLRSGCGRRREDPAAEGLDGDPSADTDVGTELAERLANQRSADSVQSALQGAARGPFDRVTPGSYTPSVPSKHPRIAVTSDPELAGALERVRVATGTREADATLVRRLAVEGAHAELGARDQRRAAAEGLLSAMDDGEFDLDLDAIDRLNQGADPAA